MKTPWEPFPYALAQAQTGYIAAPSMLNSTNGTTQPGRHGAVHLRANGSPTATSPPTPIRTTGARGSPTSSSITFKPIIDPSSRVDALESGTIDIMHTNTPQILRDLPPQHQVVLRGQQRRHSGAARCQLRHAQHRRPALQQPHAARRPWPRPATPSAYAKIIDLGINEPMTGLFLPGSPYYTKTAYPTPDPKGAAKLVKQIETADRPAGRLHPHRHQQPRRRAGGAVPPAGVAAGRHEGHHQHSGAEQPHQRRAGREVPGGHLAPVRGGRSRPQLRVVEHDDRQRPHPAQHGPQLGPPHSGRAGHRAHHRAIRPPGSRPTRRSTSTSARTSPTSTATAPPGPWPPTRTCRTSTIPITPNGSKAIGLRRRRHLADAGVGVVVGQRISTSSRYSSRQWVNCSSGRRRQ